MDIEELYEKVGADDAGVKILKTRENRYTTVDFFVSHYGSENLTYERLMSIKLEGWEKVFDNWKEKGVFD